MHGQPYVFNLIHRGTGSFANTPAITTIIAVYIEENRCRPVISNVFPRSTTAGNNVRVDFSGDDCKRITLLTSGSSQPIVDQLLAGRGTTGNQQTKNVRVTGQRSMGITLLGLDAMSRSYSATDQVTIPQPTNPTDPQTPEVYRLYTFRITCPGLVQEFTISATSEQSARTTVGPQPGCTVVLLRTE